jgi:hypothetical protein
VYEDAKGIHETKYNFEPEQSPLRFEKITDSVAKALLLFQGCWT